MTLLHIINKTLIPFEYFFFHFLEDLRKIVMYKLHIWKGALISLKEHLKNFSVTTGCQVNAL